ncbi:MAG: putative zinc-binding protein [Kiritimatiellaeota bacterium]|nr:putative zinc-binding protein [Kiritimatiellota bacterium]
MNENDKCSCNATSKLIFVCSGSSDVGAIADQAARKLTKEGKGKMYCLAGIGGRVPGMMATTKSADRILVIDACPIECASKTMEQAGFKNYIHLQLKKIGLEKGKSPVTPENIVKVAQEAALLLA